MREFVSHSQQQMTIEVYRTSVECPEQAKALVQLLRSYFPSSEINFDLDDCDKILRVKHWGAPAGSISEILIERGFLCEELV